MAVARKSTAAKTAAKTDTPAAKPVRKPRVPKPITDLATANAAFTRAKKSADRARAMADGARKESEAADAKLAEAAKVLKGYLGEVDAAMVGVLPETADEDGEFASDYDETNTDPADDDDDTDPLYHGGYGDDETETSETV